MLRKPKLLERATLERHAKRLQNHHGSHIPQAATKAMATYGKTNGAANMQANENSYDGANGANGAKAYGARTAIGAVPKNAWRTHSRQPTIGSRQPWTCNKCKQRRGMTHNRCYQCDMDKSQCLQWQPSPAATRTQSRNDRTRAAEK